MASDKNHNHVNGKGEGKCSVPMWSGGCPDGLCDKPAYSKHKGGKYSNDPYTGERLFLDGTYGGFVSGLACVGHGGLTKEEALKRNKEKLNLCDTCSKHPIECDGNPEFGTGKGNDNVYLCDGFAF